MMRPVLLTLMALLLACDDAESPRSEPVSPTPPPTPTPVPDDEPAPPPAGEAEADPLEGLDVLDSGAEASGGGAPGGVAGPSVRGSTGPCVSRGVPRLIWPRTGPSMLLAHEQGFVVAGYAPTDAGGEELFLVRVPAQGATVPLGRAPIDPPLGRLRHAPPAVGPGKRGKLLMAITDGKGEVRVGRTEAHRPGAPMEWVGVGGGADVRFAPVVFQVGDHAVTAYTDGSETPMRVRLLRLFGNEVVSRHVLNAPAMGAAAPTWVHGASPPSILFLDPRTAVSPLLQVELRADGTPKPAALGRPLANVTEPPQIAAAFSGGAIQVGYTAVGNGATTAVGWVPFGDEAVAPKALVSGTGYGSLRVSAANVASGVVFAASSPTAPDAASPRRIHLRHATGGEVAPPIVYEAPGGLTDPSVAALPSGLVAVAFNASNGVAVALVQCR